MSDNIPFEIQVEIIKRLPVKPLLQFRTVSKTWKSVIDSSKFIGDYGARHIEPQRIVIRYEDLTESHEEKYVWMVDDDHSIKQEFPPTLDTLANLLKESSVISSSHGLLCSYGHFQYSFPLRINFRTEMAVIWNPSIRKSIGIVVPDVLDCPFHTAVGFGVCPITLDPTLVKITYAGIACTRSQISNNPWEVQMFKLSTKCWRRLNLSNNIPRGSIAVTFSQVVIDKLIYWYCFDRVFSEDDTFQTNNLIVSFDMTTQEFRVVDLPNCLSSQFYEKLTISKLRDSLSVLEYSSTNEKQVCTVWMKVDDDASNSFRKLYTINTPYTLARIVAFKNNGEPILETVDSYGESATLEVYKPSTGHYHDFEIYGEDISYFVSYYMETLLLSDQPDSGIYLR